MGTLKTKLAAVTGIKQVHKYDELPGTLSVFPSLIILPRYGDQEYSLGGPRVAHHRIELTLYLAAQVLPEAMGLAVPFIKLVRDKLATCITLDGTVTHILPPPAPDRFYDGPGMIPYGDKQHTGIKFYFDVKEKETFTVTV